MLRGIIRLKSRALRCRTVICVTGNQPPVSPVGAFRSPSRPFPPDAGALQGQWCPTLSPENFDLYPWHTGRTSPPGLWVPPQTFCVPLRAIHFRTVYLWFPTGARGILVLFLLFCVPESCLGAHSVSRFSLLFTLCL